MNGARKQATASNACDRKQTGIRSSSAFVPCNAVRMPGLLYEVQISYLLYMCAARTRPTAPQRPDKPNSVLLSVLLSTCSAHSLTRSFIHVVCVPFCHFDSFFIFLSVIFFQFRLSNQIPPHLPNERKNRKTESVRRNLQRKRKRETEMISEGKRGKRGKLWIDQTLFFYLFCSLHVLPTHLLAHSFMFYVCLLPL